MHPNWQRWKGIMKAYPFEEKRLAKWNSPCIVQPKYDGIRCRAVPTESGYLLLSSEENVIHSVPHINLALDNFQLKHELDGELYCHGMSFERISSIVSRTLSTHPDHKEIQYHVFDIVNDQPQINRSWILEELRSVMPGIIVSPVYICENLDDVMRAFDTLVARGYEGIIVRHPLAPYERKRSVWMMKYKPKRVDDYEIVGTIEEISKDGVPKDTLGALVCKSGDGGVFRVGTGFSEERRKALWEAKELLPGMVARVKYQHTTSAGRVPRFPVFVEILPK